MKKSPSVTVRPISSPATYQDVLDAPPNNVAEIVDGKLYIHPRPAPAHAIASTRLGNRIGTPFDFGDGGPGGWWIIAEPELHLSEDIVVPDIAGWRRERMPRVPATAYFMLVPDWVCEVLSPSTRRFDLGGKNSVYAREGVSYFWLVDPDNRSLEAFKLRKGEWALIDRLFNNELVSLPPFEEISFSLGDLWVTNAVHKELPKDEPPSESEGTSEMESAQASK